MDFFGDNVKFKMQIQALASLLSIFANIYYINNADINLLSVINVRFVLFYNIVHYISIQPMRKAILELKKPLKNLNRHLTLSHLFIYIAILFFGLIWMFFTPSLKPQYNISTLKLIICFGSSVLIESLAEKDVIVAMNYDNTKQLTIGQCLALVVRQVGPAVLMSFNLSSTVTSFCFCQLIGSIAFVVVHHRMGKEYSYLVDSPTDKAFPTTFNQIKHFYDKEILNQVWNNYKYGLHELTWKHCASIVMTFTNLLTLKEQFIFNQIQFLSLAIINGAFMPIIEYINNDLQYKIYKNSRIGDYNEDKAVELTSTIKSTLKGFILSGVIVCLFSCTYSQTIIKMYNVTLLANNSGGKLLFLQSCYLALIMIYELIENLITSSLQEKAFAKFSYCLSIFAIVQIFGAYFFAIGQGPVALMNATIFFTFIRFLSSVIFMKRIFGDMMPSPEYMMPAISSAILLVVAGFVTSLSHFIFASTEGIIHIAAHLAIGGIMFWVVSLQIIQTEFPDISLLDRLLIRT